jgi:hypothetical protein
MIQHDVPYILIYKGHIKDSTRILNMTLVNPVFPKQKSINIKHRVFYQIEILSWLWLKFIDKY